MSLNRKVCEYYLSKIQDKCSVNRLTTKPQKFLMKIPKKRRSFGPKICEVDVKEHLASRDSLTLWSLEPMPYMIWAIWYMAIWYGPYRMVYIYDRSYIFLLQASFKTITYLYFRFLNCPWIPAASLRRQYSFDDLSNSFSFENWKFNYTRLYRYIQSNQLKSTPRVQSIKW